MVIEHLELMPEPEDTRLLTAVDPDAPGYLGAAYGVSDQEARELRWPVGPMKEFLWPWGAVSFSIGTILLLISWPWIQAYIAPILPDSEWAYENSGFREIQSEGYFGEGVHVCIVDTGIDINHTEFSGVNLVGFRDFYVEKNDEVRDVGQNYHGTQMAGLMLANSTYVGAAPEVSVSIAIALGPDGSAGQIDSVASAIRWCWISQNVDIISLSLGGDPDGSTGGFESETSLAVNEALDAGVFVVAAAGNNGIESSVSDVSTPANIERVIAVGATTRNGEVWRNSSMGSEQDPSTGELRQYPNQKPEVTAPGVMIFSTVSTSIKPSYAYSSGTSDSTVLVSSALAIILEIHGEKLRGDNGEIDQEEMLLVKRALANSAMNPGSSHDLKNGYGELNVVRWSENVALELDQ